MSEHDYTEFGGSVALRGFRLQSLYVLHRLLVSEGRGESEVLQPEGSEDLAVFRGGRLVETCQVKAFTAPLTLSDLQPAAKSGFFSRLVARRKNDPGLIGRIVTYGDVGPELSGALRGAEASLRHVTSKLVAMGIPASDARAALGATTIEQVDEAQLSDGLAGAAKDLLVGHDHRAATDLLLLWIHVASEKRELLSPDLVTARLHAVGLYLAERASHAAEWFTTVEPIAAMRLEPEQASLLRAEFLQGVAARFEHIVAGAAVPRTDHLVELDRQLATSRVVVIRGASGSGKSTLALAYLASLPDAWRFRVRDIEGRAHGHSIARALLGHARALQVPIYVHVDVGPADIGWSSAVRDLATYDEIRVLITIREEDWQRAALDAGFQFSEIQLGLDEGEARAIYGQLRSASTTAPPSFQDAWSRFGGQPGPLLEFVHLCSQGVGLRERLTTQVRRLQDDVRVGTMHPVELHLLRLVSVASAYEGVLDGAAVVRELGLPEPKRTLERFEREYLLRVSRDGERIVGLHPIRSEILAALLTDAALDPFIGSATELLDCLLPESMEAFFLFAFVRRTPDERAALIALVSAHTFSSWLALQGIARALLWRGLADYAEENRPLFDEARTNNPGFWSIMIDWDVGRLGANSAQDILASLAETFPSMKQAMAQSLLYRSRQSPTENAARLCGEWLGSVSQWPGTPRSVLEWASLGYVAFWCTRLEIEIPLETIADRAEWTRAIGHGDIQELADAALGLTINANRPSWWLDELPALLAHFQSQTRSHALIDDGKQVSVEYIIDPESPAGSTSTDPHAESMRRIRLLRRLLPDRDRYAAQGHGHRIVPADHDVTTKAIGAEHLPQGPQLAVNSLFRGYTEMWARPDTWLTFWTLLLEQRRRTTAALDRATRLVATYFRQRNPSDRGAEIGSVVASLAAIGSTIALPREAVDPWGFTTESDAKDRLATERIPGGAAVSVYREFWDSHRDYWTSVENFSRQAVHPLVLQFALGRRSPGVDEETVRIRAREAGVEENSVRLSLLNLRDAHERSSRYLAELDRLITPSLRSASLALRARESSTFRSTIAAWRELVESPEAIAADVVSRGIQRQDSAIRKLRRIAAEHLSRQIPDARWSVHDKLVDFQGFPAMVVQGDWPSAASALAATEQVVSTLSESYGLMPASEVDLTRAAAPNLLLLTMIRGRLVAPEAVVLPSMIISSGSYAPPWFRLVPKPLDDSVVRQARLRIWDDPRLRIAESTLADATLCWAYVAHLADLEIDPPSLTSVGREIVDAHLQTMGDRLVASTTRLVEQANALSELMNVELGPSELSTALPDAALQLRKIAAERLSIGNTEDLTIAAQEAMFVVTLARTAWIDAATATRDN